MCLGLGLRPGYTSLLEPRICARQEVRPFDIAFAQVDAVKASAVSVKRELGYELTATVAACLSFLSSERAAKPKRDPPPEKRW